jgi:hypothetical protein
MLSNPTDIARIENLATSHPTSSSLQIMIKVADRIKRSIMDYMYIMVPSSLLSERSGTRSTVKQRAQCTLKVQLVMVTGRVESYFRTNEDSLRDNGDTLPPPATRIDTSGPRLGSVTAAGSNH